MTEISFIPCELCEELISFEDYNEHIRECQNVYRRSFRNRSFNTYYGYMNYGRTAISYQNPIPNESLSNISTLQQEPNSLELEDHSSQQEQLQNSRLLVDRNNNHIRRLETQINRIITNYNEDERIFNAEYTRLINRYRPNNNNTQNDDNDDDMPSLVDDNDDMPSLVDDNEDDMPSLVDDNDDDMPSLVDDNEDDMPSLVDDNESEMIDDSNDILSNLYTRINNTIINISEPIYDISTENNLNTIQRQEDTHLQQEEQPLQNLSEQPPHQERHQLLTSDTLPNPPQRNISNNYFEPRIYNTNNQLIGGRLSSLYNTYLQNSRVLSNNNIGNSYEELTRLGERLGNVSVGIEKIENICKDYIIEEEEECFVCREEFVKGDKMKKLSCEHYFCENCINHWFKDNKTCPVCMAEYSNEGLIKPKKNRIECDISTYV